MISISIIGLVLVGLGWLAQLFFMNKDQPVILPSFIILYSVGVVLLVYDGFSNGTIESAAINLLSLVMALAVLARVIKSYSDE